MRYLTTKVCLPPGVPSSGLIRRVLVLIFEQYSGFRPMRYGMSFLDGKVDLERTDYDALAAFYEERKTLMVAGRTDRDFILIHPAKAYGDGTPEFPHTGSISWTTSLKEASKPQWRAAHLQQVRELMALTGSPLAQSGPDEDFERKTRRWVPLPGGLGQEQVLTVRDYSEGLAGLYWRNFLGAPFIRLLGERLDSLPGESRQDLSDELVLIQPYALPSEGGTSEGDARERQLISLLGPEHFYDHERHVSPARRPELGHAIH